MARQKLIVGAAAGFAVLLTGAILWAVGIDAPRRQVAVGDDAHPSTDAAEREARLEAKLVERDRTIGELELELALLEGRLEDLVRAQRQPATEARRLTDSSSDESTPAPPTPGELGSLVAWLREALPDEFKSLSAEEAAMLVSLNLRGSEITDAELALLANLTHLRRLDLRGARITDDGIFQLRSLGLLEHLELRGTGLTGEALRDLPAWNLEALHLTGTKITGADLVSLPPMQKLQVLKLNRLSFGDEHIHHLAQYTNLRHLELDQTAITDVGLERLLAQNPALRRIELRNTQVTQEGVRALLERYPGREFVLDSGIPNSAYF